MLQAVSSEDSEDTNNSVQESGSVQNTSSYSDQECKGDSDDNILLPNT